MLSQRTRSTLRISRKKTLSTVNVEFTEGWDDPRGGLTEKFFSPPLGPAAPP